ncbi:hypothetical protein NLJ89_g10633 [Agrocybe chaxingu]|uniref:MYND-type domain-containing protein n=1 Tax=Agrocybe chaxingu TaxID=84603 RepID=A0A9W8MNR2_9AGAR|nr:hypothetical protein NLJ89_g10633 [Agrocybe chaxingu]
MPSAPLGKHGAWLKQCMYCHISERDGQKLMSCAACRVAHYCNRECQKNDWKNHKAACTLNQNGDRVVRKATEESVMINGLMFKEVDHRFKKWQQVAQPVLSTLLLDALDLHADKDRCFTHMLWVTVVENMSSKTPKAATSSDIVKYFRVEDAEVKLIAALVPTLTDAGMRSAITSSVEQSRSMRKTGAAFGILIMVVYLESLNLQQLVTINKI